MQTFMGIYQISISPDADSAAFEEAMRKDLFPAIGVGQPTRGGMATAQYLTQSESSGPEQKYLWIVQWQNAGGSPFGRANAPGDPAPRLKAFGAKTSFARSVLLAEENAY